MLERTKGEFGRETKAKHRRINISDLLSQLVGGLAVWSTPPCVPVQGSSRELPGESYVLMKSGSQLGENDFRLGVICTDSLGTKLSYTVFQWGNYWHVVKHATPKRLSLYTIFCMAELADLMHGALFASRLWTSCGTVLMELC